MTIIGENIVSIRDSGEPCDGCREPISKSHIVVRAKDTEDMVFCPSCYDYFRLSAEEKALYVEKVRNEKQCSTCGIVKTEDIRTIAASDGVARFYCTTCIDRANLSAEEKWSLNQAEVSAKKMIGKGDI